MGEFTQRTTVDAPASELFSYLRKVENLPDYMDRMQDAEVTGDGEVHTRAHLPERAPGDAETVEGDAWFRVDEDARRLEWGAEGDRGYHGWLEVTGDDRRSEVEVHVTTEQVEEGGEAGTGVEESLRATLAHIREQVEGGGTDGVDDGGPGPAHASDATTQADAGLT